VGARLNYGMIFLLIEKFQNIFREAPLENLINSQKKVPISTNPSP
jgi:hypothetical protein